MDNYESCYLGFPFPRDYQSSKHFTIRRNRLWFFRWPLLKYSVLYTYLHRLYHIWQSSCSILFSWYVFIFGISIRIRSQSKSVTHTIHFAMGLPVWANSIIEPFSMRIYPRWQFKLRTRIIHNLINDFIGIDRQYLEAVDASLWYTTYR